MTTQTTPAPSVGKTRPWGLIGLLVAVVAAALAVLAYVAFSGDSTPTITFDGETATYDGPATFDAGEHRFVFDNSGSDVDVAFALNVVTDPAMTEADLAADAAAGPEGFGRPDYLDPFMAKIFWANQDDPEDRILDETFLLEGDTRWAMYVVPARGENLPVQFVGTFEVK